MYYKIINKECEVYKKLHEMRSKELKIEEDNIQSIKNKTGLEFINTYGNHGQQNFRRVSLYAGFEFKEPEKVNPKIWKRHHEETSVFVPNKRTKLGREISDFLLNGLQSGRFDEPLEILGLVHPHRFTFPFIHVQNDDIIIMYLDDQMEPQDKNIIEITKKEFNELYK